MKMDDSNEVDIYSGLLSPPSGATDDNKGKSVTIDGGASTSSLKMLPPPSPQDDSSIMSTFDLYSDLIDEENRPKETVETLHAENDANQDKIGGLQAKIECLQKENLSVQQQNALLKKNISALLKTAKLEMKRKDWELTQLRLSANNESEREQRKHPVYPNPPPPDMERSRRNHGFDPDRVNPNLMPLGKQRNMGGSTRQAGRLSGRDQDRSKSPVRRRQDGPHTPPPVKDDLKDRSKSPVRHKPRGPHTPPPLKEDVIKDRAISHRHRPSRGPHTPPPIDRPVNDRSKSSHEDSVKERSKSPAKSKSRDRSSSPADKCTKSKSRERSHSPAIHHAISARTHSKERSHSSSQSTKMRSRERSKSPRSLSEKSSKSKPRSHSPTFVLPKKTDRRRGSYEQSYPEKSNRDSGRSYSRYSDREKHCERKYERHESRTESRHERTSRRSDDKETKASSNKYDRRRESRDTERRKREDKRRYEREMNRLSESIRKRRVERSRRSVERENTHTETSHHQDEEQLRKRHNSEVARKKSVRKAKEALNKFKFTPPKAGVNDRESAEARHALRLRGVTRNLEEKLSPVRTAPGDEEVDGKCPDVSGVRTGTNLSKSNVEEDGKPRCSGDGGTEIQESKANLEDGEISSEDESKVCLQRTKEQRTKKTVSRYRKITYDKPSSEIVSTVIKVVPDKKQESADIDDVKSTTEDANIITGKTGETQETLEVKTATPAEDAIGYTHCDSTEEILDYNESDLESESDPVGNIVVENPSVVDENSLAASTEILKDSSDVAPSSEDKVIVSVVRTSGSGSSATANLEKEEVIVPDSVMEECSSPSIDDSCTNSRSTGECSESTMSEQNHNVQSKSLDNNEGKEFSSAIIPDVSGSENKASSGTAADGILQEQKSDDVITDIGSPAKQSSGTVGSGHDSNKTQQTKTTIPTDTESSVIRDISEQWVMSKPDVHLQKTNVEGAPLVAEPDTLITDSTGATSNAHLIHPEESFSSACDKHVVNEAGVTESIHGESEPESKTSIAALHEPGLPATSGEPKQQNIRESAVSEPALNETNASVSDESKPTTSPGKPSPRNKQVDLIKPGTPPVPDHIESSNAQESHPLDHSISEDRSVMESSALRKPDVYPVETKVGSSGNDQAVVALEECIGKQTALEEPHDCSVNSLIVPGQETESTCGDDSRCRCTVEYIDHCIDTAEKLRNRSQVIPSEDVIPVELSGATKKKRKRSSSVKQDEQNEINSKKSKIETSDLNADLSVADTKSDARLSGDSPVEDVTVQNIAKDIHKKDTKTLQVTKDIETKVMPQDGANNPLRREPSVTDDKMEISSKDAMPHASGIQKEDLRMTQLKVDNREDRTISPPLMYEFSSHFMETIDTPMMKRKCSTTSPDGSQGDSDHHSESFNSSGASSHGTGDLHHISDGIDKIIQHTGDTSHSLGSSQEQIEKLEAAAERALDIIFASRFSQRIQQFKESKSKNRKRRKISDTSSHHSIITGDGEEGSSKDVLSKPVATDETSLDGFSYTQMQSTTEQVIVAQSSNTHVHPQQEPDINDARNNVEFHSAIVAEDDKPSNIQFNASGLNTNASVIVSSSNDELHAAEHFEIDNQTVSNPQSSNEPSSIGDDDIANHMRQSPEHIPVLEPKEENLMVSPDSVIFKEPATIEDDISLSPDAAIFKKPATREDDISLSPGTVIFKEPPGREEEVSSCTPPSLHSADKDANNADDFMELHPSDTSLIDDVFHEEIVSSTVDTETSKSGSSRMTSTPNEKSSVTKSSKDIPCKKTSVGHSIVEQSSSACKKSSNLKSKQESMSSNKQSKSSRSDRSKSNASNTSRGSKDDRDRHSRERGSSLSHASSKAQKSTNSRNDKERNRSTKSLSSSDQAKDHRSIRSDKRKERASRHKPLRSERRDGRVQSDGDSRYRRERTPPSSKDDIKSILRSVSMQIATEIDTINTRKAVKCREPVHPKPLQKVGRNRLGPWGLNLSGDADVPIESKDNIAPSKVDTKVNRKRPHDESLSEGEIVSDDDESDTEVISPQLKPSNHAAQRDIAKNTVPNSRNRGRNAPLRESQPRHKLMAERDRRRSGRQTTRSSRR